MVVTPQPVSMVASNPAQSDISIEDNTMSTSSAAMPRAAANEMKRIITVHCNWISLLNHSCSEGKI